MRGVLVPCTEYHTQSGTIAPGVKSRDSVVATYVRRMNTGSSLYGTFDWFGSSRDMREYYRANTTLGPQVIEIFGASIPQHWRDFLTRKDLDADRSRD